MDRGIYKIHGGVSEPIPDTAMVEWRTPDGELHSRRVSVRPAVPPSFSGDLFFEIMPDHTVRVRARDELPPLTTNPDEPGS